MKEFYTKDEELFKKRLEEYSIDSFINPHIKK